MRVLSISNCPLREDQGSGYVIVNFCNGLKRRGHHVDLFGPETFEPFQFFKGRAKSYRQAIGMLLLVVHKLLCEKYDVIEFYGAESWLSTVCIRHIPYRRFLIVSHSNGLEAYYKETLVKLLGTTTLDGSTRKWFQIDFPHLFQLAFTKADGLVTVSKRDRDYSIVKSYQRENKVVAIENSLSNDFLNLRIKFERPNVVGFCGSWLLNKGISTIQTDVSKILSDFPDCVFKLIGVGKDFQKEKYFPPAVCSQIEVIPFVSQKQELRSLYESISILILPSIYESFGLVVTEAMACGCAVVATKTGFAASLIDREQVLCMAEPSSPFLFDCIKELLNDEPLRLKIAKAGYQRVQTLKWENAVDKLESTYQEWLNEFREKKRLYETRPK